MDEEASHGASRAKRRKWNLTTKQGTALRRLQRWYRRHLRPVLIWSATNAGMVWRRQRRFFIKLVEPCGSFFNFDARALAKLFVATASFQHPITRRELLSVEVTRIVKHVPPVSGLLLRFSWELREMAQNAGREHDSLAELLSADAGQALDVFLCEVELGLPIEDHSVLLFEYETAMLAAVSRVPHAATKLLKHHRALAERRKNLCEEEAWASLRDLFTQIKEVIVDMPRPTFDCAVARYLVA